MSEYLFCDFCNVEANLNKKYKLPDSWAEALGVPIGTEACRGMAAGSFQTVSGWMNLGDSVHKCPVCIQEEKERKSFRGKKGVAALQMMAAAIEEK